ncbi:MAG: tRNA (adenosine(37)-N6)-dimethylallyltransferase MiaA [Methanosarcinales archaeon]|nr:tRNA (adenosine(37)-N6)-dimethylallyltransferase MiaA [Methanosarcinales archaeon]
MKKIIVILGPTGSGKTKISIDLAKKFNGEIVSADSRQVYRFLDIGTDKIAKEKMDGIVHHLLDVASPKRIFSVVQYQKKALNAIKNIHKRDKIPFIVGGSGFYIQSIVDNIAYPKTKRDNKLRKKLAKKGVKELFSILEKLDPVRAKNIDKKNPVRLIRAIEIAKQLEKVSPITKKTSPYQFLIIGLKINENKIDDICKKRFNKWIKRGLIKEIKNLQEIGLSWEKIESFGLYYFILAQYIQGKISRKEAFEKSIISLRQYIKKQITWFKKEKRIVWVDNKKEALDKIQGFLKN